MFFSPKYTIIYGSCHADKRKRLHTGRRLWNIGMSGPLFQEQRFFSIDLQDNGNGRGYEYVACKDSLFQQLPVGTEHLVGRSLKNVADMVVPGLDFEE